MTTADKLREVNEQIEAAKKLYDQYPASDNYRRKLSLLRNQKKRLKAKLVKPPVVGCG